jgi:hypothetical protein
MPLADPSMTVLESCNSIWVFDTDRLRFRRILKGIEVHDRVVATAWRPYARLELAADSEAFTVLLNEEGTRMICSWRHTRDCAECGAQATSELSLRAIEAALT